ncbi:alpha/beta fold hydrolase [Sphingobacterium daejeonense]|jgi:pimeloyl-ACP methyl ester carboxylesterase|uniref:Alpha/beta fold hydrolase n=1 Tax=Sphingobacterium daejeonense TaxID=371142 RepID=A0ABW3RGM5_9SPHI|nr:alpha/beta hydrolase [Sphingobacterium sp. 1.A.5]
MMKKFALFLILLLSFPCLNIFAQQPTYVIVHGAWGGSWQFKNTANELEKLGSKVYRVNLTGLGERYHLANADINLSTHIKDVVNTILFERLDSVILIGHSYGGMVVTGVADSIPEKLKKVIYLDAFLPENGESVAAYVEGSPTADIISSPDGEYVFPSWVKDTTAFPRDVPHPLASIKESIVLKNSKRLEIPSTYILTFDPKNGVGKDDFYFFSTRAKKYNWKVIEMEADHNPQINKLDELVKILNNEK